MAREWIIGSEVHELIDWSPFEDVNSDNISSIPTNIRTRIVIDEQASVVSDDTDESQ